MIAPLIIKRSSPITIYTWDFVEFWHKLQMKILLCGMDRGNSLKCRESFKYFGVVIEIFIGVNLRLSECIKHLKYNGQ